MRISESRLSGLYFFLTFLALVFGFSIYKSFYAVVSPKYLEAVLRARLQKEVTLYELKVDVVEFNFFHGIFFRPGLAWKGFHVSYSKNCNYIEVSSPDVYFSVDLTRLFRRKLELEEVITSQLEVAIIKDYACTENAKPNLQGRTMISPPAIGVSSRHAAIEELGIVKSLPDFRVGKLKLITERNAARFMEFTNLTIAAKGKAYNFLSDLTFSPDFNMGNIPLLKISGSFDENQNIKINARLREAKLDLEIVPLGDKNFKTTFTVSDFPMQYVLNMLKGRHPELSRIKPMVGEWIHLKTHTVSRWDDFFAKNIVMYFEEFRLTGDFAKLTSEPFQLKLKDRELASTSKIKIEMLAMEEIFPYIFTSELNQLVLNAGQTSGDLSIRTDGKLLFVGIWRNATLFIEPYGLKNNIEVLPTKVSYELSSEGSFFDTKDLAIKGAAGDLHLSSLAKADKVTAKFTASNMVANEMWKKLFSATIDFTDIKVDVIQDESFRWKGEAVFRGFSGRQFDIARGKVEFERNLISDKINWINEHVKLKDSSNLKSWIGDIFEQKIEPDILSHWKSFQSRDLNKDKASEYLELIGSKPRFTLILEDEKDNETYSVKKASPRINRQEIPKVKSLVF